jgi:NADH dehydrogenase/NADH:ubiquinone oxidoreductase 75 kD subunit (chain G)
MSNPGPLYRPYDELIKITILGKEFQVPAGNMLLRAMQYLAPETVAMGRFCWNEECQYCRVQFKSTPEAEPRQALSCKLLVQPGMEIVEAATEIRYCLRDLKLGK